MKKWTRRRFMEASLTGSILAGGGAISAFSKMAGNPQPGAAQKPVRKLRPAELNVLKAAMDEMIPKNGAMPAASEAGGVEYLARLSGELPGLGDDLRRGLAALNHESRSRFGKSFAALSSEERVEILKHLEKSSPKTFTTLRDYTYEAYYIQPQVWKLLDYTLYPTNGAGPKMKPFDEAVLANVRRKPKYYREVD